MDSELTFWKTTGLSQRAGAEGVASQGQGEQDVQRHKGRKVLGALRSLTEGGTAGVKGA